MTTLNSLGQLHDAVRSGLQAGLPGVSTVAQYPSDAASLAPPAVSIAMTGLLPGRDPATGETGLAACMQARLIYDAAPTGAELAVRELSARLAVLLHDQTWGLPVGPAQMTGAMPDPEPPQGRCAWLVEWRHAIELGAASWPYPDRSGVTVMLGLDPETGAGHEADYVPLNGA
jgi:hypothetical protein